DEKSQGDGEDEAHGENGNNHTAVLGSELFILGAVGRYLYKPSATFRPRQLNPLGCNQEKAPVAAAQIPLVVRLHAESRRGPGEGFNLQNVAHSRRLSNGRVLFVEHSYVTADIARKRS